MGILYRRGFFNTIGHNRPVRNILHSGRLIKKKPCSVLNLYGGEELQPGQLGHRVNGAAYATTADFQYMGIYHGSGHIGMSKQLLHGTDIVPGLQNCGCK